MFISGRNRFQGLNHLTQTMNVDLFAGIIEGDGHCSEQTPTGTVLVYDGAANQPAIRVTRCAEAAFRDFRIKGNDERRASAAIIVEAGNQGPFNTGLKFNNIWIGAMSGEPIRTLQFTDGFVVGGANLQGDQSGIDGLFVQGVADAAIDFRQSQEVLWDMRVVHVNSAAVGIRTCTRYMTVRSLFFSSIGAACVEMPRDADINITGFGAEQCGRLLKAVDGFDACFERGYFQLDDRTLAADACIVDARTSTRGVLRLRDVGFSRNEPYTGVAPRLKVRGRNCLIELDNVALPPGFTIDQVLDFQTETATDRRHVILRDVSASGEHYSGEFTWRGTQAAPVFSVNCSR